MVSVTYGNSETINSPHGNSYLKETSFVSEISERHRREINEKYGRSEVNAVYVFPRLAEKWINRREIREKQDKRGPKRRRTQIGPSYYDASKHSLPIIQNRSLGRHVRYLNETLTVISKYAKSPLKTDSLNFEFSFFVASKLKKVKRRCK